MERRGAQHQHLVRAQGRAQPQARLGADRIRLQAKQQAEFNTRLYYGPINPDAFAHIPPEIARQLPTYGANMAVSVKEDDQWEAERIAQIEQRFTQWVAS